MITCPKCSKENQDHYKFCLGCGAELPRDAAPKAFSPQTPPHGMRAAAQARPRQRRSAPAAAPRSAAAQVSVAPRPQAAAAPAAAAPLPLAAQCRARSVDTSTRPSNKFCASCGYNMTLVAAAPRRCGGAGCCGRAGPAR